MRYRNLRTGAIINTPCKVSGKNWAAILPPSAPAEKPKVKTAAKAKTAKPDAEKKPTKAKKGK